MAEVGDPGFGKPPVEPASGPVGRMPPVEPVSGPVGGKPPVEPISSPVRGKPPVEPISSPVGGKPPVEPISSPGGGEPPVEPAPGPVGGKPPSTDEARNGHDGDSKHTRASSLDEWFRYMSTMLGCVGSEKVEACSISLVPHQLRKLKEQAYMPRVVSIGPLHKETSTDLLYMEEIKWRYLLRLLQRSEKNSVLMKKVLENCGKAMLKLDAIIRASYNVDDIKFNRNKLAQIMVLDGCFLLELLIRRSPQLINQLKCSSDSESDDASLGGEKLLSDLIILENQIPLMVLQKLSTKLFPKVSVNIYEHALSTLGYDYDTLGSSRSNLKAFHFLELVHSFIDKEKDDREKKPTKESSISIGGTEEESNTTDYRRVKLERCATRLEAAGVTIKLPPALSEVAKTRFDLKVEFSNGTLEIPQLQITETTEAKWRNFIAWELNRATLEKQRGVRKQERVSCQFISYAWFFRRLICCVHDVKLLRYRKIIVVQKVQSENGQQKIMSDKELMDLFHNITKGIPEDEIDVDSLFGRVIEKLNSYPTSADRSTATCRIIADGVMRTSRIMWHNLRCFLTWIWYKWIEAYGVLKSVYIPSGWGLIAVLAAAAGLALTAVQTHYSI